jgi:hypothetical protein
MKDNSYAMERNLAMKDSSYAMDNAMVIQRLTIQ